MFHFRGRLPATLAVVVSAVAFMGIGVALSNALEQTPPDVTELRDAVNAAAKRGDNVAEIRKSLEAFEKAIAKGWTPPAAGKTIEPPSELLELRHTVEAAARKGENVEEILKQLEVVEKAVTGKTQAKPKPLPPVEPAQPDNPFQLPLGPGNLQLQPFPQPVFPNAGIDADAVRKAEELFRKGSELLRKNPNDPEGMKIMQQAQEMILKAMVGGGRGFGQAMVAPNFGIRVPERFRLGVRLERISELAADQLGLEVARGVGIVGVVEGSPAEKAGFKTYDIVLEFAGKPVSDNPEDFTRIVTEAKAGAKIDAVVLRKGKKVEIRGIDLPEVAQVLPGANPFEGLPQLPELNRPAARPSARAMEVPGRLAGGNSVSYTVVNGQININAVQNNVTYTITLKRDAADQEQTKIIITDGDNKIEADQLDKVPEAYRPVVEKFLKVGRARLQRD
jgi:hypothetical protein